MQDFDQKELRTIFGQYPTGVTVITTKDKNGSPVGMTANSFASVSLSPPLVLWSVDKMRNTHDVYTQSQHFCVHIVDDSQQALSDRFASKKEDRFSEMEWSEGVLDSPVLSGCLCSIECETEAIYPGGDHSLILGKVVNTNLESSKNPLIFHKGNYKKL